MRAKQIAIIGSGISGLTSAYYLSGSHEVTVYEAADYIGGHTHTVEVGKDGERAHIDTGFIVFNDRTYPHFIRLITELGVAYQPTEMSFSVRNDLIDLEYNGNNLNSLFAQRANLLRLRFWRMLADILRFNRDVRQQSKDDDCLTIGQYLARNNYSSLFRENYLLPMISAIWSMGLESCADFPLRFFAQFFDNHGLLDITNRPQWYTIQGGSNRYIEPLTARFAQNIRLKSPVLGVERREDGVYVQAGDGRQRFDEVVLAVHGDQALALLSQPTESERSVLGAFHCTDNRVLLHTDVSLLPKRKLAWASWNYKMEDTEREQATLTYNMNILQRLHTRHTYLVTLNQDIDKEHVLGRFDYRHPVYTTEVIAAQKKWHAISGVDRVHYCGAYWFNGFHEDGVRSALRVCEVLKGDRQ